jgi:hypothetical protein
MDKQASSDRNIRTKFIIPALCKSGWNEMLQIRYEVSFTESRIIERSKPVSHSWAKRR